MGTTYRYKVGKEYVDITAVSIGRDKMVLFKDNFGGVTHFMTDDLEKQFVNGVENYLVNMGVDYMITAGLLKETKFNKLIKERMKMAEESAVHMLQDVSQSIEALLSYEDKKVRETLKELGEKIVSNVE